MKKIIFLFTFYVSLFTFHVNSQWLQQTSGTTSNLLDCDFVNQNTGWTCGNGGVILKTTNGGINWVQQSSGVNKRLEGIDAVDANILYSVGWDETILKTTNGGNIWFAIRNGPPMQGGSFFKVFFLNENTGWILRNNYIMRTTNGCLTFDSTFVVFTNLRDIYFKDASTGVLCANGARIMKSTDGGVTWNLIPVPLHNFGQPNFYRISFVNNTFGWTVGEGSSSGLGKLVYRSTDFGSTWDTIGRVPYPDGIFNYSVFFSSLNTGYCGGEFGYTFKTTNGGFNWYQQVVPSNGFRRDFYLLNDSIGWSIGGGGQIYKTTNGGTYVGIQNISNKAPEKFKLYQNYPNPFNSNSKIKYQISKNNQKVKILVFDIMGKEITQLVNQTQNAGTYEVDFDGSNYPTGVYFFELIADNKIIDTKKLILIK